MTAVNRPYPMPGYLHRLAQQLGCVTPSHWVSALKRPATPCNNHYKPKGPVRRNTVNAEVAAPTYKRGFVTPEYPGFGRGGLVRKAGRMTAFMFLTPCPPAARRNANGGLQSYAGATTMPTIGSTPARPSTAKTTPTDALALNQQASNALSMAAYYFDHGNTPGAARKAVQALAAMRDLRTLANPHQTTEV